MTTSSWNRARRVAAASSVPTVLARAAHHDPCALIVGPAKAYCERDATTASAERRDVTGAAWLAAAGAGVAALVVCRPRSPAGQRRR
ncbi:hypothetical protein GCM10010478_16390 [Streptomyces erythrogriseus]|uniref:Uncharacterized protein n=1 Tax=Streptomyces erythrogriseus TaxID=284027 RepID=A0ABN3WJ37_9ACTN